MNSKSLIKILKAVLFGMLICGLISFLIAFPGFGRHYVNLYPQYKSWYWPWMGFLWMAGLPCFMVLFFGWRMIVNLENDRLFTEDTADCLKWIAVLAACNSAFFLVGNVVMLAFKMNFPIVVFRAAMAAFAGIVIAVVSATIEIAVREAAVLQQQSDLTI